MPRSLHQLLTCGIIYSVRPIKTKIIKEALLTMLAIAKSNTTFWWIIIILVLIILLFGDGLISSREECCC